MKRSNSNGRMRLGQVMILLLLAVAAIAFAWQMSRMSAAASNTMSYGLVDLSAELLMEQPVAWEAGYWHDAYNMALRKLGHFREYLLIGLLASLFFLTLFERLFQHAVDRGRVTRGSWHRGWLTLLSALLSALICFGASWADEFVWQQLSQRHPRWFDVGVDMTGALLGITASVALFSIGRWLGARGDRI